jgi:HEPN domain-containing protein
MTPGKFLNEETRGWLLKAREDLLMAELALRNGFPETAVYHCQQAAEKSLKAFLTFHQEPFRKTHLLEELGEACRALDPDLPVKVRDNPSCPRRSGPRGLEY